MNISKARFGICQKCVNLQQTSTLGKYARTNGSLKKSGSLSILGDIIKQRVCQKERKASDRAETIPNMLDNGLIEEVEPTRRSDTYSLFSDGRHKQIAINVMYFLNITDEAVSV